MLAALGAGLRLLASAVEGHGLALVGVVVQQSYCAFFRNAISGAAHDKHGTDVLIL